MITRLFYQIEAMMVIPYYHHYGKNARLYCVEDSPQRVFWTNWGDPAFDTPTYGTLCIAALELQESHTLLVAALSDTRMEVLQDLVRPLELGTPQMQLDPFPRLEKPVRKASRGERRRPS